MGSYHWSLRARLPGGCRGAGAGVGKSWTLQLVSLGNKKKPLIRNVVEKPELEEEKVSDLEELEFRGLSGVESVPLLLGNSRNDSQKRTCGYCRGKELGRLGGGAGTTPKNL